MQCKYEHNYAGENIHEGTEKGKRGRVDGERKGCREKGERRKGPPGMSEVCASPTQ